MPVVCSKSIAKGEDLFTIKKGSRIKTDLFPFFYMKLKNPLTGYLITLIYIAVAIVTVLFMVDDLLGYSRKQVQYQETLTWENRLLNAREWISDAEDLNPKMRTAQQQFDTAKTALEKSQFHAWLLAGYTLAFMLLVVLLYYGGHAFPRVIAVAFTGISLAYLIAGVFTPMLEIAAFKENLFIPLKINMFVEIDISHTFQGKMFFFYQNKSIFQMVELLFVTGNAWVALIILLFSIITPLLKLIGTFLVLFVPETRKTGVMLFIRKIGKWSMLDVFVVSIFVAMLAFNNMSTGIDMTTAVLPGFYFFAFYVVLSLISSVLVKTALKAEKTDPAMLVMEETIADQPLKNDHGVQ